MNAPYEQLAAELEERGFGGADVALVLGSGLGAFAERLRDARSVSYEDLDRMPASGVPGHAGRLVLGELDGCRVLIQQGRVHLYEGWSVEDVTRAARAFVQLGCRAVVLTNAAGGLHADWPPGTLMRLTDHLNLTGRTPLTAPERAAGSPYDAEVGAAIDAAAEEAGVELRRGVYAGLLGPSYETAAEIRMLTWMGADAVGMSTVTEAVAAAAAGARVAAVSCITNLAAGIGTAPLSHDEVMEAGRQAADRFAKLLARAVPAVAVATTR